MLWNFKIIFLFSSIPSLWYEDCPHYLRKVLFVLFCTQGKVHRRDRDEDAWSQGCVEYAPNTASPISFSGAVCKARDLEPSVVKKGSDPALSAGALAVHSEPELLSVLACRHVIVAMNKCRWLWKGLQSEQILGVGSWSSLMREDKESVSGVGVVWHLAHEELEHCGSWGWGWQLRMSLEQHRYWRGDSRFTAEWWGFCMNISHWDPLVSDVKLSQRAFTTRHGSTACSKLGVAVLVCWWGVERSGQEEPCKKSCLHLVEQSSPNIRAAYIWWPEPEGQDSVFELLGS